MNTKELKLNYPCSWEYKVILESHHNIKQILKGIFNTKEYVLKKSQDSKQGKYQSYTISTIVYSDEERKALFEELKKHKSIKFVL